MSIKEFLETNTQQNVGTTLPIPYLEIIEVDDQEIVIRSTIYVPIDSAQVTRDAGAEYIQYLADSSLGTYAMLLFDRDTTTTKFGRVIQAQDSPSTAVWYERDINVYSNTVNGTYSPLKNLIERSETAASYPNESMIMTKFSMPSLANPIVRAAVLSFLYHNKLEESPFWPYYMRDGITEPTYERDGTGTIETVTDAEWMQYSWAPDTSDSDLGPMSDAGNLRDGWASTDPATVKEIDHLIGQMVANNDPVLINMLKVISSYEQVKASGTTSVVAIESAALIDAYGTQAVSEYFGLTIDGSAVVMTFVPKNLYGIGLFKNYGDGDTKTINSDGVAAAVEVIHHADGSASYKFVKDVTLHAGGDSPDLVAPADQQSESYISWNIFNLDGRIGASKVGLVSFSTLLELDDVDFRKEIVEAYEDKDGQIQIYENALSPLNSKVIFEKDSIAQDPVEVYMDENGTAYEEVIQALNGNYYANSSVTLNSIATSIGTIETPPSMRENTTDGLRYILTLHGQSPELLKHLNRYRIVFPDKSSVTPAGQFYTTFAEMLGTTNELVLQGTPVQKRIVNNPVVRDYRMTTFDAPVLPARKDNEDDRRALFWIGDGFWSRYTQIVDYDPSQKVWSGTEDGEARMTDGGQWDYNFVDHGFFFFNYEKAIKTDSALSQIMDVKKFEKYFGTLCTSQAYKMESVLVHSIMKDPDVAGEDQVTTGMIQAPIDNTDITPKITCNLFRSTGNSAGGMVFGDGSLDSIGRDRFTTRYTEQADEAGSFRKELIESQTSGTTAEGYSEATLGTAADRDGPLDTEHVAARTAIDEGGAHVIPDDSIIYSYLIMRSFIPVVNTGDDPVAILQMDKTFLLEDPMNYRYVCFEYVKNDIYYHDIDSGVEYEALDAIATQANDWQYFMAKMIIQDDTYELFKSFYTRLEVVRGEMDEYLEAASDHCAYNNTGGYFNEFFVRAAAEKYPHASSAPWYKAAAMYWFVQDILFDMFSADTALMVDKIKAEIYNISPDTGTLESIQSFQTRWGALMSYFDQFAPGSDFESDLVTRFLVGSRNFPSTADIDAQFVSRGTWDAGGDAPHGYFAPPMDYDNYPKYPESSTSPDADGGTIREYTYSPPMTAADGSDIDVAPGGASWVFVDDDDDPGDLTVSDGPGAVDSGPGPDSDLIGGIPDELDF